MEKRAQSALEFTVLVGAILFFFIVFLFGIQTNISEQVRENKDVVVSEIAKSVQDEINLASESKDGYYREFMVPNHVLNVDYDLEIIDGYISVKTDDEKHAIALPLGDVIGEIQRGINEIRNVDGKVCINLGELECFEAIEGGGEGETERLVFISSFNRYNGDFGGLARADLECRNLADVSPLPHVRGRNWKAWMSGDNSGDSAAERLEHSNLLYRLVDQTTLIADGWDDLVDGTIANPINMDEKGNPVFGSSVWTGTNGDGSARTGRTCGSWNDGTTGELGYYGSSSQTNSGWTLSGFVSCNTNNRRIYCIEQS